MNWGWLSEKIDNALEIDGNKKEGNKNVEVNKTPMKKEPVKVNTPEVKKVSVIEEEEGFEFEEIPDEEPGVELSNASNKENEEIGEEEQEKSEETKGEISKEKTEEEGESETQIVKETPPPQGNSEVSDHSSHASKTVEATPPSEGNEKMKKLQRELDNSRKALKIREQQILSKSNQIQHLLSTIERMKHSSDHSSSSSSSYSSSAVSKLKKENRKFRDEVGKLKTKLKKRQEDYDEVMEEGKELSVNIYKLEERNSTLKQKLSMSEKKVEALSSATLKIKKQKEGMVDKSKFDKLQSQLNTLKERYSMEQTKFEKRIQQQEDSRTNIFDTLRKEFQEKENEYLKTISSFQFTIDSQQSKYSSKIDHLTKEISELTKFKDEHMHHKTDTIISKIKESDHLELKKKLTQLETKLTSQEQTSENERTRFDLELQNLNQKLEIAKLQSSNHLETISFMKAENSRMKEYIEKLKLQNSKISGEIDMITKQVKVEVENRYMERIRTLEEQLEKKVPEEIEVETEENQNSSVSAVDSDSISPRTPKTKVNHSVHSGRKRKSRVVLESTPPRSEEEYIPEEFTVEFIRLKKEYKRVIERLARSEEANDAFRKMQIRYDAAKELITSKNDKILNLQEDMKYVKKMFQSQTIQLLQEIENLKKNKNSTEKS